MKNYLSLWIANLGVVPLFSLAFFLLRPAFFCLSFLLVLVCVVFDAIILSFKKTDFIINRPVKLTISLCIVKIFLLQNVAYGQEKEIYLAKGEQKSLKTSKITKFSLGNDEVIAVKTQGVKGQVLLKGKKIGFSDLIIWSENEKKVYKVFVTTKAAHLKRVSLLENIKKIGISSKLIGENISLKGKLKTFEQYTLLHRLINKSKVEIISHVEISTNLKRKLLTKVYNYFYKNGYRPTCSFEFHNMECQLEVVDLKDSFIKKAKRKFSINILNDHTLLRNNFKLSFKILKLQKTDSHIRDLSFQGINTKLINIISSNYNSIMEGETFELQDTNISVSVVAKPQVYLTINNPSHVKLGGEIPIVTSNISGSNTTWKFYGLNIKSTLKSLNSALALEYNASLTTPFEKNINGSQGKSLVYIKQNKFQKLFEIGYEQGNIKDESTPLLSKIPLIKYLFTKNSNSNNNQKIICFVKLEKINE
ncbi:MAG: pilus assembly protein N-terminal domain-containing protein [Bacteriovoracaceae bacterium]|jgi:hypothetical protein|nr:pilus assembly protein N-terminal domain-containing protein [Bacteriovoracaceae bacterium]